MISTLPKVGIRRGEYVGDVKYRKAVSKRLRSLGFNEVKTYTLVSPEMSSHFDYEGKEKAILPNPMSVDKSVVRTTLIPSLLQVYQYNKARKVEDVAIYEVAKTYDKSYQEESKIAFLMQGDYVVNPWKSSVSCDFYLMKGFVEDILCYFGFQNRYQFVNANLPDMHPGKSCQILIDRKPVGILGQVHPRVCKDEVYVCEISLQALMQHVKPLKFKEASKYPTIAKDVAFVVDKDVISCDIEATIKKAGGRLLQSIEVFDVYEGEHVAEGKKSIAYNLLFMADDRTLTDEEVMKVFDQIIDKVASVHSAEVRDK